MWGLGKIPDAHNVDVVFARRFIGIFHQVSESVFLKARSRHKIAHFVGLSSKLYAYLIEILYKKYGKLKEPEEEEIRKAKGVKKNVIKKSLTFEDYKKCLFSEEKVMREMNMFKTQNHDIYSMTVNKVALSANDDKRIICPNKINTLALRPVLIMKNNMTNK